MSELPVTAELGKLVDARDDKCSIKFFEGIAMMRKISSQDK